ncbi:hypothetical protein GCM10010252_78330 [Streptomyces aureoverticillatus]|nr:hypothetical protein GCM10010252_78330 [Streptomyces aureoverticillatus]
MGDRLVISILKDILGKVSCVCDKVCNVKNFEERVVNGNVLFFSGYVC